MSTTPTPNASVPAGVWSYPTQIRFGEGRISELSRCCESLGIERPLVVTDEGLARHSMIEGALESLRDTGMAAVLFAEVRGNPTGRNVLDGVDAFRSGGHDGVVVIGGGSAMDAGKTIAMVQGQDGPLFDMHVTAPGAKSIDANGIAPIIAVPTTAGTGSETGRAAVITEESTKTKRIFAHPKMMPGIVIEDPKLTVGLPANLTAWTGIDALAHCFEAYCAPDPHPMADGIALEGMRLVKTYLPRAVAQGGDLEARSNMLFAASMGSTAFQKGLGAIHSIAHSLGALYDTHHGLTNAVLFPYVLDFNKPVLGEKMDRMSAYLGLGATEGKGTGAVLDWILSFRADLGIPATLEGLGVDDRDAALVAQMSAADPTAPTNPVPLDAESLDRIFRAALSGRLG